MATKSYGFEKRIDGQDFDAVLARTVEALRGEGFGVLTEIDVKATLRKKLDADFRRYVILGACNPHLAHQALLAEPQLGLLLPCNAVVQEGLDGGIVVSVIDPGAMFAVVGNPAMAPVAADVAAKLRRVLAGIG